MSSAERRRSVRQLALVLPLSAAACADPEVLVLGQSTPVSWHFSEPRLHSELGSAAKTDNPSLSADLLLMFFTSERSGNADLYMAERSSVQDNFTTPVRIDALSSDGVETSPAVTPDALTLYWASDREGGQGDLDSWMSTRPSRSAAWSVPSNLRALNSSAKDLPRLPGLHGSLMPLSSDRNERGYYSVLFARRDDQTQSYVSPEPVPELHFERASTVDGFLTDDGLTLFYVTGPAIGNADMFVASRRNPSDPFEHFTALAELNTASDERDPWLSADGTRFFFSSNRSGRYAIYEAEVSRADF
jgi:Tol biopolymer transport system component